MLVGSEIAFNTLAIQDTGGGMTDQKKFEYIKRTLTIGVIDHMMKTRGWSEEEALKRFMCSEVYNGHRDESTKVWHFNVRQLSLLFEDELEGDLIWPEQP